MTKQMNNNKVMQYLTEAEGLLGNVQAGVDVMINSSDGDAMSPYVMKCLKWIEDGMAKASAKLVACHESVVSNNKGKVKQHLEAAEGLLDNVQSGVDVMINLSDGGTLSQYVDKCLIQIEDSMAKASAKLVACH